MYDVDVNAEMDAQVSEDLIRATQEADLIPEGRYKFQLESVEASVSNKEFFDKEGKNRNPFYGKPMYNLRMRLTSVRSSNDSPFLILDRPRTYFQRVSPANVLDRRGELSLESKLFGQMAGIATKALGRVPSVRSVLDWFRDNAAEVVISRSEASERDGKHYDAKNWTRAIKAIS